LIDELLSEKPYCYGVGTPREEGRRGGHVAVEHDEAMRITEALRARDVVPDFRPPNVVRIAPVPLYNTYHEVWKVAQHLKEIIDCREFEKYPEQRKAVS
jgi:kynureninase